jgi:sigma-B regulation protein RsbQ
VGASPRYLNDEGYKGGFDQASLDGLYEMMSTNYFAWVSGFAPMAMGNPENPDLAASFARTLGAIRPDIAQSVARVIFQSDHRKELNLVSKEVLVLQTKQDIAVPMDVAEFLHKEIKGSKLEVLEADGHFPHISAPLAVAKAISSFIG